MKIYLFMGFKEELGLKGLKGSIELIQDEGLLKEELWLIKEDDNPVFAKEMEDVESKRELWLTEEDIPWWPVVSEEDILYVSEKRPVPLDLKKGKPFRGESLAIKYDLVSAWKKTRIANGNIAPVRSGKSLNNDVKKYPKTGARKTEILLNLLVSFTSLVLMTRPFLRVNSSWLMSSVKSSLNVPMKGLVLTTTILAMTDRTRNTTSDITSLAIAGTLIRKINPEINSGESHSSKIESLFLVQYVLLNMEIICLNLLSLFIHYYSIARCLSQAFCDLKTSFQPHYYHQPQLFLLSQPIQSSNLFRRSPHAEL